MLLRLDFRALKLHGCAAVETLGHSAKLAPVPGALLPEGVTGTILYGSKSMRKYRFYGPKELNRTYFAPMDYTGAPCPGRLVGQCRITETSDVQCAAALP